MSASNHDVLLLGVDGGGTRCRARLTDADGAVLGHGVAGAANIRFGLKESFAAVESAVAQCLTHAGLSEANPRIIACLALAGASEPRELAQAQQYPHPYRRTIITTDAEAACVGAHAGEDGAIVIVGTGSIGWATIQGRHYRVGGWGFPLSDEGSGAWIGAEVLRRVLWAHDGLIRSTGVLDATFEQFDRDPNAIVRWIGKARPRDFASLAPIVVEHAAAGDAVAMDIMRLAAGHVERILAKLQQFGVPRFALMGGLAGKVEPYLSDDIRHMLSPPIGDALTGALHLARREAERLALVEA